MTETCENCGTPVSVIDQRQVWAILGLADTSGLPGPRFYEHHPTPSEPGSVAIEQVPHTPSRCREARAKRQETPA